MSRKDAPPRPPDPDAGLDIWLPVCQLRIERLADEEVWIRVETPEGRVWHLSLCAESALSVLIEEDTPGA